MRFPSNLAQKLRIVSRLASYTLLLSAACFHVDAQLSRRPSIEPGLPAQRLAPDDLISVEIYDAPEFSGETRVDGNGQIHLPLVKNPIRASGLLPIDLQSAIAGELQAELLLNHPAVTVTPLEYRSKPVSVIGAVKTPTTFYASGDMTLVDALARAGGLTDAAGADILVSKKGQPDGAAQKISVRGLLRHESPVSDIRLYGGEEIKVPPAPKYYVMGNIKKPGSYNLDDGTQTSVLRVLAVSEGLLPYANKTAYIYRENPESAAGRTEIAVPLQQILNRKQPDVELQANDIFYVPDNKGKRLTAETLEKMTSFGSYTLSGLLIWH